MTVVYFSERSRLNRSPGGKSCGHLWIPYRLIDFNSTDDTLNLNRINRLLVTPTFFAIAYEILTMVPDSLSCFFFSDVDIHDVLDGRINFIERLRMARGLCSKKRQSKSGFCFVSKRVLVKILWYTLKQLNVVQKQNYLIMVHSIFVCRV